MAGPDHNAPNHAPSGGTMPVANTANRKQSAPDWRYWPLWISLLVHVLFFGFLSCTREWGGVRSGLMWFDLFLALRFLLARLRNETGWGWVVYLALLWTSVFWFSPVLHAAAEIRKYWLYS